MYYLQKYLDLKEYVDRLEPEIHNLWSVRVERDYWHRLYKELRKEMYE